MLAESSVQGSRISLFSTKQLMMLTSIRSSGTVRRGLEGLIAKLSIERQDDGRNGNGETRRQYLSGIHEKFWRSGPPWGLGLSCGCGN